VNDPAVVSVGQAARMCGITFEHAWHFLAIGKWKHIHVNLCGGGLNLKVIRVHTDDVYRQRVEWDIREKPKRRNSHSVKSHRKLSMGTS